LPRDVIGQSRKNINVTHLVAICGLFGSIPYNPHANKLTVHILAAVAQHEREAISERTKDALRAAKARGTKLGNPHIAQARRKAVEALKASADHFAANVLPIIRPLQRGGTSNNAIAGQLNERSVKTARGGKWTHVQVGNILARAG
jgi:DNA invertase Pin-like site-specific DNA recombinase